MKNKPVRNQNGLENTGKENLQDIIPWPYPPVPQTPSTSSSRRARGDADVRQALLARHRERLERMVKLRMDPSVFVVLKERDT